MAPGRSSDRARWRHGQEAGREPEFLSRDEDYTDFGVQFPSMQWSTVRLWRNHADKSI